MARRAVLAAAVGVAILAGACSSNSPGASATAASSSPSHPLSVLAAPTATVTPPFALGGTVKDVNNFDLRPEGKTASILVSLYDDVYGPTFVRVAAGATVKVVLENRGTTTHTFTIDSLHVDQTLAKGQTATITITMPATGSVNFYCRFHKALGMQGAVYVTPPSGE